MKTINENLQKKTIIAALLAATLAGCDGQDEKTPEEIAAPPTMAATKPVVPPAAPATVTPQPAPLTPAPAPTVTLPETYHATLEEGIDFGRDALPDFLQEVKGLIPRFKKESNSNFDGRLSDATLHPSIQLVFKNSLPKKYTLIIDGIAYASNAKLPGKIVTGGITKNIQFSKDILTGKIPATETVRVNIETKSPANTIDIIPPHPVTAKEVGGGMENRQKLGYYIRTIKIVPDRQ